jgi:NAD(P)-dependent dehydrogenase (short-subunit alcohol dehydrogenase family)
MDALDFTGRVVLVTGGTRGIGAGIARAFLAAGAEVLVCARHDPGGLPRSGDRVAHFQPADIRDPAQAAALVAAAVERLGRLDVLVNNAGGAPFATAGTASPRLHAKIIELNLIAPLHVSQAANEVMRHQPTGGTIIMIGSMSGVRPSPGTAAYGAAKAGLHHLAASLAAEWAPQVRVNTVIAGPVDTSTDLPAPAGTAPRPAPVGIAQATEAGPPGETSTSAGAPVSSHAAPAPDQPTTPPAAEANGAVPGHVSAAAIAGTVPMGRAATPAEIAGACLFLASPLAAFVSGAQLAVHGGGEWPGYLTDFRRTAH